MAWGDKDRQWGNFQWGQRRAVEVTAGSPLEALQSGEGVQKDAAIPFRSGGSGRIRRCGSTRVLQNIAQALVDVDEELKGAVFTEERIILVDPDTVPAPVVVPTSLNPTAQFPLIIAGTNGKSVVDADGATVGFRILVQFVQVIRIGVRNATISFSVEANNVVLDGVQGSSSVGITASNVVGLEAVNAVLSPDRIGVDLTGVTDFVVANCSIRVASTESAALAAGLSIVGSTGSVELNVVKVLRVRGQPTACISLSDSPYVVVDRNLYRAVQDAIVGRIELSPGAGFSEAADLAAWQALSGLDANSLEAEPLFANDPTEGELSAVAVVSGEVVLTDDDKAFVTDELREEVVEFRSGPLAGQEFLVRTNDGQTVTLQDADPTSLPAVGDLYRIQTGRGNALVSLRPRARSPVAGAFVPAPEADVDADGNVRAGDLVSVGAFEMKDVRLTDRRALLLEILAGTAGDFLSTVFAGKGGSLDRFTPKHKPTSDQGLAEQILSTPIRGASVTANRLILDLAMGIDATFPGRLEDGVIDFQDELGVGTSDGRIAIVRSGQRIPLDPRQQITHEVKVALEVVRS